MGKKHHTREKRILFYPGVLARPEDYCRFVQWDGFVADWQDLGYTDDDLRELEIAITMHPKGPPVVPGTGGLRKIRFASAAQAHGKRGGARVGYCYFEKYSLVLLLVAYGKKERSDISEKGKQIIRKFIHAISDQLDAKGRGTR